MMKKLTITGTALALVLQAGSAFAATSSGSTSTASASDVAPSVFSKIGMTYGGYLYGPALGNMDMNQPNATGGQRSDGIMLYNSLSASYKMSGSEKVYVNPRFNMRPTQATNGRFEMLNPRIGYKNSSIYSNGNFNIAFAFNPELGLTEKSQKKGMRVAPGINPNLTYTLGRWTFGLDNYARAYLYSKNAVMNPQTGKGKDIDVALATIPNVSYQINPRLSTALATEIEAGHYRTASASDIDSLGTNVNATLYWEAVPSKWTVGPYVKVFPFGPGATVNPDTTQLGVEIAGTIF